MLDTSHLHDLKSIGNHMLHSAKRNGTDVSSPLAFMGAITVAIGVKMLLDLHKKSEGRSR